MKICYIAPVKTEKEKSHKSTYLFCAPMVSLMPAVVRCPSITSSLMNGGSAISYMTGGTISASSANIGIITIIAMSVACAAVQTATKGNNKK